MAQRRMFSNRIANSARFLQMPAEAQLLYFHMVLRGDDDGIVESYPLMRLLSVAPDNFKVLLAKGFVQLLNEDQVIVITDWLEHNTIRADRKVDSIYKNLLPEGLKTIEPKPRSDVQDNSKRVSGQSTDGLSKVRLGEDRIGKDKETGLAPQSTAVIPAQATNAESGQKRFMQPSVTDVQAYCAERGNSIDAEGFVDFYTSKGWKVGGQAMKDWRACVRTWEKRDKGKANGRIKTMTLV